MNQRNTLFRLIVALALTGISTALFAADPVGRVLLAAGDSFAVRDGKEIRLAFNSPIEFKDLLRTGAASSLQIRFVDDSLLSLRDNTEFAIEEYQFTGKAEEQRSFFRLVKGGFRAVTGLIGRTNNASYRVRAETATIGIRGTDYAVRNCQGDCGAGVKNGLYGSVLGLSSGTNQITVTNNAGESTFGINQHFYVPDANTRPQPLLQPPSFVAVKPQGKAQATQQGGSGSGRESSSGSSGASGDSRPQSVVDSTVPLTRTTGITTVYTVTNTVTTTGTTTLFPAFSLGGLGVVPGQGVPCTSTNCNTDDGGGAFLTASMLTLDAKGIPTAINVPSGCTGPNNDCKNGFQATLGTPVQSGSAFPNGSSQGIFWGRWQSGTINDGGTITTLSTAVNAHFMYGSLTPAEVLSAKTGVLNLSSTFPGGFGTTPTNNLGQTPISGQLPTISVNFGSRVATASASFVNFPSQSWQFPSGSGPITIVAGAGGFFQIQGSGSQPASGWICNGTGCGITGVATISGKAAGIFFGPVGDHAGVTLSGQSATNGQVTANFGAVRVYCVSGC
jgi:hypothetical protein